MIFTQKKVNQIIDLNLSYFFEYLQAQAFISELTNFKDWSECYLKWLKEFTGSKKC